MIHFSEDIRRLTPPEKAELYCLLRDDDDLRTYMMSNQMLFEELSRRDKAYSEGKLKLTSRQQLSSRLKRRRDAL